MTSLPVIGRVNVKWRSSDTIPMVDRSSNTSHTSCPRILNMTPSSPATGYNSRRMVLRNEDLPAPLGPRIAIFSPSWTLIETESRTFFLPLKTVT